MRSSTVFILVGALIVLVLVYAAYRNSTVSKHPVMRRTDEFLMAMSKQDVATIKQCLDDNYGHVQAEGSSMSAIKFDALTSFEGKNQSLAFSSRPPVTWTYVRLVSLAVDKTNEPTINAEDGLATVTMTDGSMIYLHVKNGEWLIFYIAEPKATQ